MSQNNSTEIIYDRALTLQKQGDWESAEKEYLQIIAQQPNYALDRNLLTQFDRTDSKFSETLGCNRSECGALKSL